MVNLNKFIKGKTNIIAGSQNKALMGMNGAYNCLTNNGRKKARNSLIFDIR